MSGAKSIKSAEVELIIVAPETQLTLSVSETVLDVGSHMDVPLLPEYYSQYMGEYEVTSSLEEQTLLTEKKYLEHNVVIKSIPSSNVSNLAGGSTFYIGKVVEE